MKKLLLSVAIVPLTLTIVACGGSSSPPPPPPPPPVADTTAPTVSFSPTTATVVSGGTVASTLSATDNVGVTTGPTISCTNGGSFISNVFTAPAVTADTTSVCTATAGDAAGNSGSATLTVTVTPPPPDTTAPIVTFSPATITLASGATAASTLTATDNVGVTTGPTVTCTNGGSFANNTFTAPTTTTDVTSVCTATAGDAAGNTGTGTLTANVTGVVPGAKVTISGATTFDFVPFQADNTGLDYNNISQRPIRGHVVEALDGADNILVSGITDAAGNYSLEVDPNTQVRIQVKAQILKTTGNTWDVSTVDNTNSEALYALQGSLTSSGATNSTRDLNAPSGWDGSSYANDRSAAPFAILSPIYDTLQLIDASSTGLVFPQVNMNWSTLNRAVSGDRAAGEIGTSSYVGNGTSGQVYILGDANNDTDEYDDHVIVHEWGHYFEDRMSRSDSIGGQHGGSDRLDMRVAMGEGWGNALSGMGTGDPFYKDSGGPSQSGGFAFSVEGNNYANEGWFNEGSVQSILYDIFDADDDSVDTLSLGFGPIIAVFTSSEYKEQPLFTSIFSFTDRLKEVSPASASEIEGLKAAQNILGVDSEGTGETNNGGIATSLPVYKELTVGGAAVNICSVDDAGNYNKLNNRTHLKIDVAAAGSVTIAMTKTSGPATTDPDFYVYNQGALLTRAESGADNSETLAVAFPAAGTYVIDAYEFTNVQGGGTDACFDMTAN